MEEIWKDIEGYEGIYQVSNLGRARSLDRTIISGAYNSPMFKKGTILKPQPKGYIGYVGLSLSKDGKRENVYIHRLVAKAFIPNPDNLPEVNHKDENKKNNRADNLEWVTTQENINYGTRTQRHRASLEPKMKPVVMKATDGTILRKFDSIKDAARQTGINRKDIRNCCEHIDMFYTAGGFVWEYKHNENAPVRPVPERRKAVIQMQEDGVEIATYTSAKDAALATGADASSIKQCCQGRSKHAGGYKWKYKEPKFE
jgi:hypothetical protein